VQCRRIAEAISLQAHIAISTSAAGLPASFVNIHQKLCSYLVGDEHFQTDVSMVLSFILIQNRQ